MYGPDGGGGSYDDDDQWDQDSGSDYDDFGDATYGSRSRGGKGDIIREKQISSENLFTFLSYFNFNLLSFAFQPDLRSRGIGRNKGRNSRPKGRSGGRDRSSGGGMGGNNASKRRTHADNIPDSEKPFSCDRKLAFLTIISLATNLRDNCLTRLCNTVHYATN